MLNTYIRLVYKISMIRCFYHKAETVSFILWPMISDSTTLPVADLPTTRNSRRALGAERTSRLLSKSESKCGMYGNRFTKCRPASWSSGQSFWLLIVRSRVRFPALPWEFFPEGEDSRGDHGLGRLVEFRFKGPPGTPSSYITTHIIGTT
jgi:hypothetical protein